MVQGICTRCDGLKYHPIKAKRTHISLIYRYDSSRPSIFGFRIWIGKRTDHQCQPISEILTSWADRIRPAQLYWSRPKSSEEDLILSFRCISLQNSNTVSLFFLSFRVCLLSLLPWLFGQYLLDCIRMYALLLYWAPPIIYWVRTFLGLISFTVQAVSLAVYVICVPY